LDAWKSFVNELKTKRKNEYLSSRKRLGLKHERAWLQHTPMGDFVVVSVEGDKPEKFMDRALASKDPFDQWFAKQIATIHGISGAPPPRERVVPRLGVVRDRSFLAKSLNNSPNGRYFPTVTNNRGF